MHIIIHRFYKSILRKIAQESLFLILKSTLFRSLTVNGNKEFRKSSVLQRKGFKQPG